MLSRDIRKYIKQDKDPETEKQMLAEYKENYRKENYRNICVVLREEQRDIIRKYAKRKNISISKLVRDAVLEYINNHP